MDTTYFCGKEQRREEVRAKGILNGIDYLEVDHPAQTTITVTFLRNLGALTKDNFVIEGGVRIRDIKIQTLTIAANVATILVDKRGDFSMYTLRVRAGLANDNPPAGFDGVLCTVEFSFKVQCPSDFDCKPDDDCPEESEEDVSIDYLAKDYQTFRRLMLDRMSVTMPAWKERNPADIEIALVELMAYLGDQLSYYQDSVATEAYLGTARRRSSIRRHARLLDYFMHEGCTARTFVCLQVTPASAADGAVIKKGAVFLDRTNGEGTQVSTVTYGGYSNPQMAFEAMHDVSLSSTRNIIDFHTWSDFDCCLPRGATHATLVKANGMVLAPGDLLALYETLNPVDGQNIGADPAHRHVVRLKTVKPGHDDHENVDVLEVTWFPEDALPFALCLSVTVEDKAFANVSVACGNVVLADHGQRLPAEPLIPPSPIQDEKYLPTMRTIDLSFRSGFDQSTAKKASAFSALQNDPHAALADIALSTAAGNWEVMSDLLRSGPFDPHFVVEVENDRSVHFRFGDDLNGQMPNPVDVFTVIPRIGNGVIGNIGRDSLTRVVFDTAGVENVWNPLPATGGVEPEALNDVKEYAPEAYKVQERAVTEPDYAMIAERHTEVQAAQAQFRWTGSWYTVFLVVDRLGGLPVTKDPEFKASILAHMDRYRMAGVDMELRDPIFVPLEIVLHVCVSNGYFQADVRKRLARAFSNATFADGETGFFSPDNFTFGQSVYLSQVLSVAMSVQGVDHVTATTFKRWSESPNQEIEKGRIHIAVNEIAQLSNDPNFPEDGRITFELEGGL